MKKILLIIVSLFLLLQLSCVSKNEENVTFNKEIYMPEYSSGFKIVGNNENDDIKIISLNPWQGAENISSDFLISQNKDLIKNPNIQGIKGKAERIVCMSSTHIAMLDALNATDKIVGVSGKQYISNPYVHDHADEIADVGYEGNIDYEKLISTKPDLVLLYAVNGASTMEPKLKELGIPFMYVGDYLEENPLGKAEWLVAIAEIIGERDLGIQKFNEISKRYQALKETVDQAELPKPAVMLNAPFSDAWFMPSTKSYVARLIQDAGGEYIYKRNTGNSALPIDLEAALMLVSKSDFWLNMGTIQSLEELENLVPRFMKADCVKNGNLYNNNFRTTSGGGNDCYESGIVNPDIVLRDLIKIFHPSLIDEDLYYYHRLE